MLQQALTYARAVFYAQDRKWVLCIFFHWTERKVHFCFCCRSGVISTPSYDLDDKDGFKATVRGFVGILSLKDEAAAGILPSEMASRSHGENLHREGMSLKTNHSARTWDKSCESCGATNQSSCNSGAQPGGRRDGTREQAWPIRVSQRIRNRAAAVKSPGSAPLGREGQGQKTPKGAPSLLPGPSGQSVRDTVSDGTMRPNDPLICVPPGTRTLLLERRISKLALLARSLSRLPGYIWQSFARLQCLPSSRRLAPVQ
jgi:hypothetical protein